MLEAKELVSVKPGQLNAENSLIDVAASTSAELSSVEMFIHIIISEMGEDNL
jgi:hypothetical protein